MSFSYSGNPSSSVLDEVRFLLGDTDSADPLLTNEEITYTITKQGGNASLAAADAADALVARFTREVSFSVDGISVSTQELQKKFIDLAAALRAGDAFNRRLGMPYVGGVFKSDEDKDNNNNDIRPLSFRSGMHDTYGLDDSSVYNPESLSPGNPNG